MQKIFVLIITFSISLIAAPPPDSIRASVEYLRWAPGTASHGAVAATASYPFKCRMIIGPALTTLPGSENPKELVFGLDANTECRADIDATVKRLAEGSYDVRISQGGKQLVTSEKKGPGLFLVRK